MKTCEDCGEEAKRRTRCPNCKQLLCGWCYNHCHMLAVKSGDDGCALRAMAKRNPQATAEEDQL